MEAAGSSEVLVSFYQTAWRHILDHGLHGIVETEAADSSKMLVPKYLTLYASKQTITAMRTSDLTDILKYPWQMQYISALRYT
jgi:hypothetical protein